MEMLLAVLVLVVAVFLAAFVTRGVLRRRAPAVRLQVAPWREPRWYLLQLELANRSSVPLSAIALEARAPKRARLLERGFVENFAIPGRDGVRRPDPRAASRSVPLPLQVGPRGSLAVVETYERSRPDVQLEEVAADCDRQEVLLYLPRPWRLNFLPAWRTTQLRLALHYVCGDQPDRRRTLDVVVPLIDQVNQFNHRVLAKNA